MNELLEQMKLENDVLLKIISGNYTTENCDEFVKICKRTWKKEFLEAVDNDDGMLHQFFPEADKSEEEIEGEGEDYVCKDCGYSLNKWEFDAGKGRLMFCEGNDIEEGEYRCGRCDERCGDPEGMFPNDDDNDAT